MRSGRLRYTPMGHPYYLLSGPLELWFYIPRPTQWRVYVWSTLIPVDTPVYYVHYCCRYPALPRRKSRRGELVFIASSLPIFCPRDLCNAAPQVGGDNWVLLRPLLRLCKAWLAIAQISSGYYFALIRPGLMKAPPARPVGHRKFLDHRPI